MNNTSPIKKRAMKWVAGIGLVGATWFGVSEFDSPDEIGSGKLMNPILVGKLDSIREDVGFALIINSGVRTLHQNESVGGVEKSAHTSPCFCAVDIRVRTKAQRDTLIASARRHGINRIGVGWSFVHLDIDSTKPSPALWYY